MGLLAALNAPPTESKITTSLLHALGVNNAREAVWRERGMGAFKPPASDSDDLRRILALPWRERPSEEEQSTLAEKWTRLLGYENYNCTCAPGRCLTKLRPIQGWEFEEAKRSGGMLGFLRVGAGKTAGDILLACVVGAKRAVLLLPASLRPQLLHDYEAWSQHFKVPNLAGGKGPFYPDRPVLQVLSYSQLSSAKQRAVLVASKPDIFILDEFQHVKNKNAARTRRWLRYLETELGTRVFAHSGSPTSRSVKDYSHVSLLTLRESSPVPIDPTAVDEWASVIDPPPPGTFSAPIGALRALCEQGETARSGFRRRLLGTLGVVATEDVRIDTGLILRRRELECPDAVRTAMDAARGGMRPDGEEFAEQLQVANCLTQLAAGFYYRWRFPHMEPPELIDLWFRRRQAWNRELREALKYSVEHLDSPLLLEHAAARYYAGKNATVEAPTWKSEAYLPWIEVENQVYHEQEPVWISDFMAEDAIKWAKEAPGIVWVDHVALGHRIAKLSDLPYFGAGEKASEEILKETGSRSIVASIAAHSLGKNLQVFSRNLIANPPADGEAYEQVCGRTHRDGQKAAEVMVDVYQHTLELRGAFKKATELAQYAFETTGNVKKLIYAQRVDLPSVTG